MLAGLLPAVMLPVLLNDAARTFRLQERFQDWATGHRKSLSHRLVLVAAFALALAMMASQTVSAVQYYRSLEPINFRGTSLVRTDKDSSALLHWALSELEQVSGLFLATKSLQPVLLGRSEATDRDAQQQYVGAVIVRATTASNSDLERQSGTVCSQNTSASQTLRPWPGRHQTAAAAIHRQKLHCGSIERAIPNLAPKRQLGIVELTAPQAIPNRFPSRQTRSVERSPQR